MSGDQEDHDRNFAETRPCPECSKKMIQRDTGEVLTSYPPKYPWRWWCGCGHSEPGGIRVGMTADEWCLEMWRDINKEYPTRQGEAYEIPDDMYTPMPITFEDGELTDDG